MEVEQYARKGEGDGRWITIGGTEGEDGHKHGGHPVFIKGGRIEKGAPGLVGKTIPELKKEDKHSGWTDRAREHKVHPKRLHQLAHEIHTHDASFAADKTNMLKEARKLSMDLGHVSLMGIAARNARGKLDADKLRGLDDVAARMQARYPEYLGTDPDAAQEKLFDLLVAGNPRAMSKDDAYDQALDHLIEEKRAARSRRKSEPAPF